jgi:hypothetical protein
MIQLDQWGAFDKIRVLEVNWYSPEAVRPFDLKFPPDRRYQVLTLTGDKTADNIKLDFAQVAIQEMVANYDTVNGVRLHYTDTADYESFVRALDICLRQDAINYAPYKNDIWIFNVFKNEKSKSLLYWTCGLSRNILPVSRSERFAYAFHYVYDLRFWPVLIMIIVLVGVSFRNQIRPPVHKRMSY